MDAIVYVLHTGCQWQALPKNFPARSTIYGYFWDWRRYGVLDRMHHALLRTARAWTRWRSMRRRWSRM